MFKLVKYEFKSQYKSLLGIIVAIAVLSLVSVFANPATDLNSGTIAFVITSLGFFALGVATFVVVLLNCIKSFSKYLYHSEGYLLFSTPEKGSSIVGSRLIISLVQIVVSQLALGAFLYFAIIKKALDMANITNFWSTIFRYIDSSVVTIIAYIVISGLLGIIVFLLTVYFSMLLSKSLIPFQKHQGLIAFITFIVINLIINYVAFKISNLILVDIPIKNIQMGMANMGDVIISQGTSTISLSSLLFSLIISILLFMGASYLIDNKLEL